MSYKSKKPTEKAGQDRAILESARQILAEHGESPDYWILAASEAEGKLTFLCATPPFPAHTGYAGPLLESVLANNLSLAVRLTSNEHYFEGIACVALGFLAPRLAKASPNLEDAEVSSDFVQLVHIKRQAGPLLALRSALGEMFRLGYGRLKTPFIPHYKGSPKLELTVKPDGSMAIGSFDPQTSIGRFVASMSASAVRAKLTRLKQSAQNCGGCGRCCHDGDIPLTHFDLGGLAAARFADLFARQPELALAEVRANFVISRATLPGEVPGLVQADRLLLRKKDGTTGEGSPCAFLDGRGLCSVYEGRPLLCRLYHCARTSPALETLYYSVYYNLEWLGRAVQSGLWRPDQLITSDLIFEQSLGQLASFSALALVAQELKSKIL